MLNLYHTNPECFLVSTIMYYDDPYDPNKPNDYDDAEPNDYGGNGNYEIESIVSSAIYRGGSISESDNYRRKRQSKLMEELKKTDPDYRKITVYEGRIKKFIDVYNTSSNPGATIRDAITGAKHIGYKVGMNDEKMFFKVGVPGVSQNGCILFFDNPDQYERHFRVTVSSEIKDKWNESYKRQNAIRLARDADRDLRGPTLVK